MKNKGHEIIELDGKQYRVKGARYLGSNRYTCDAFVTKRSRLYPVEGVQKLDKLARMYLSLPT